MDPANCCKTFEQRFFARLIDYAVWAGFAALLLRVPISHPWLSIEGNAPAALLNVGFCFLYYPVGEALGGTPGKRLLGLSTTQEGSSRRLSFLQALLKGLCQFIPIALFYVCIVFIGTDNTAPKALFHLDIALGFFSLLAPLSLFVTRDHRTWHDKITRSDVKMRTYL